MLKTLKMTGILLIVTISITVIGAISFFSFAPQIGAKPQGERMERMLSADNYRIGKFHNTVPTKMDMKSGRMMGVMWEFLANNKNREPVSTFKVDRFNPDKFLSLDSDHVTFTWFGHSSILLNMDDIMLLIDPVFSERASIFSFMGPKRFPYTNHMTVDLLPRLDAVLISHDHYDHLDYETIQKLKGKVQKFIVPLGVGAHLEKWGISPEHIIELNWWESLDIKDLTLTFAPSRHFSGRGLNNRFSTLWGAWAIKGRTQNLFFGGDSGYFPGFKEIGNRLGPFDLAFLECGAYNENWSEIHMMPEETVQASLDLNSRLLMPIHWGKFNLALHPWKEPIQRAKMKADELKVKIISPEIGKFVTLNDEVTTTEWWANYK